MSSAFIISFFYEFYGHLDGSNGRLDGFLSFMKLFNYTLIHQLDTSNDQRLVSMNQRGASKDQRAVSMNQMPFSIDQKPVSMDQMAISMNQKLISMNQMLS